MSDVIILKKDDIIGYIELIKLCFGYEATIKQVNKMRKKYKTIIFKDEEKVIASALINNKYDYIKGVYIYEIDYFCVHPDYQRKGLATKLLEKIEIMAHNNNVSYITLTSSKKRVGAQKFYKKSGFEKKDTNVFFKEMK